MRQRSRGTQRGQALPIFALASLFIIGTVALAVDFGFLADQHRNLQVFSDEASTAGAYKLGPNPGPAERTAARKAAFIYLRDNLGLGGTVTLANVMAQAGCSDFTSNVGTAGSASCPIPNTSYKVSIWSPAEGIPAGQDLGYTRTVSVRVSESVTRALAGVFSGSNVPVGAFSVAQYGPGQPNFALYSDGCVNILSNKLESMAGNLYLNECTLNPQGNGAFCTYTEGPSTSPRLGASSGSAVYGPYANLPATILSNQTVAGCQVPAAPAGIEAATANVIKSPYEESPPAYAPPPSIPTTLGTATNTKSCRAHVTASGASTPGNGSKDATGADPGNCYDPGAYTTIGLDNPIANNLNPGVYHIYGNTTSTCYTSPTETNCAAVLFGDNTLNANYNDVVHRCWALPQVPTAATFSAPCPDGFIDDPTTGVTDPQCAPSCPATALSPPAVTLGNGLLPGSLDPLGTGTTYYVRVTSVNGFGESVSSADLSWNVVSPTHTGSILLTLTTPRAGATGYRIYGPSLTPATETLNPASLGTTAGSTVTLGSVPVSTTLYPLLDSTACPGFCNIPLRSTDNYGVTFVLEGKAGVCIGQVTDGVHCDDTDTHPIVLLSPYCAAGFVAAGSGTSATQVCNSTGQSSNDGAFVFYGPTQGSIRLGGKNTGVTLGVTGVLDTPRAFLDIDEGRFHAVPGQVIVHNLDIDSVNALDPLVYFGLGPPPPISVHLIQ